MGTEPTNPRKSKNTTENTRRSKANWTMRGQGTTCHRTKYNLKTQSESVIKRGKSNPRKVRQRVAKRRCLATRWRGSDLKFTEVFESRCTPARGKALLPCNALECTCFQIHVNLFESRGVPACGKVSLPGSAVACTCLHTRIKLFESLARQRVAGLPCHALALKAFQIL